MENIDNKEKLIEARVYYDFPGSYKPWSGAVDTWDTIERAGAIDDLENFLDEMYPEGIGETELNDLLWFDGDYVLESLGLSESDEDEDEEDLEESKIREGLGPENEGHKIIKYHGFSIEKNFYDDKVYPYSVQYCGDDCMFKTLKAAKEFIDDINDVETIEEKKMREKLEQISNRAYGQWVALKNKMGDEYLADYVIDNIPKHEAELIIDYLADVNGIEVDDEGNNLAHGFLG